MPVTQRQALHDEPVNIRFGEGVLVPDDLDRRKLPSSQRVDRVVFASNSDDHCARALAPQLALGNLDRRPSKNQHRGSGNGAENEQRKHLYYVLHSYARTLAASLAPKSFPFD